MQELIKLNPHNLEKPVSARDLHAFVESSQDFSTWIKSRIEKYGFVENQDYDLLHKIVEQVSGAKRLIEYALTLDCAKEMGMVEGNEKGREIRKYFIELEKSIQNELLTHDQVIYLTELKEVFKYLSHCQDAERMHQASFVSSYQGKDNPYGAFHRMRNQILEATPEKIDSRIRQYCLENQRRIPKSKRGKIEMLNPYESLRNGVWDFLNGRGKAGALPLANLVQRMAEKENAPIFRSNQTDLFQQAENVAMRQLA